MDKNSQEIREAQGSRMPAALAGDEQTIFHNIARKAIHAFAEPLSVARESLQS